MDQKIIDVREYPEFASGHIAGSHLVSLGTLSHASADWDRAAPLTLVCKSGRRAEQARQQLASKGFTNLQVLKGGIDQWRSSGKPLSVAEKRPWSMERQVRTTAGSLIVVSLGLAYAFSPRFLIATGLVGAGLVFAGVTDTCMMASLLGRLPWNRSNECAV